MLANHSSIKGSSAAHSRVDVERGRDLRRGHVQAVEVASGVGT